MKVSVSYPPETHEDGNVTERITTAVTIEECTIDELVAQFERNPELEATVTIKFAYPKG